MKLLRRNIELVKLVMEKVIKENDLCVDATLGNGNDTLCMLKQKARVLSFDIQENAIKNSKKLLEENNIDVNDMEDKVKFILDSHSNIDKYLNENDKIKFATFNLGYLPNGNKEIITKKESTIKALKIILLHLAKDGVISIIAYYDHKGGLEEKEAVDSFLKSLDSNLYEVVKIDKYNNEKNVPITYFIYR